MGGHWLRRPDGPIRFERPAALRTARKPNPHQRPSWKSQGEAVGPRPAHNNSNSDGRQFILGVLGPQRSENLSISASQATDRSTFCSPMPGGRSQAASDAPGTERRFAWTLTGEPCVAAIARQMTSTQIPELTSGLPKVVQGYPARGFGPALHCPLLQSATLQSATVTDIGQFRL